LIDGDRVRSPRVGLVDDEEDITTYLGLALEDRGYDVLSCNDAAGALDRLRSWGPDVVCLDLLMPEEMGTSLYLALRRDAHLATVPIVILSGLNAREELSMFLARLSDVPPPDGYIEKPVDMSAFMTAIKALAGRGRSVAT
jgi:two-component system alkaline phosphatase synthesis response regulator PhoP